MGLVNYLVDIDQVQPGFNFNFPELREEWSYDEWFAGNFNTLLPSANFVNGRALFDDPDLIRFNPFRNISEFISTAVIADPPSYTAANPESSAVRWLDTYFPYMHRVLEKAAVWWARRGLSVLVVEKEEGEALGAFNTLNPSHYFSVGSIEQEDTLRGHIIARPYHEPTRQELLDPYLLQSASNTPNRCQVFRFMPSQEINDVTLYTASGTWTRWSIEGLHTPTQPANIQQIVTLGDGESWYGDAKHVVAQAMIMATAWGVDLYKFINSARLIPYSAMTDGSSPGSFGMSPTARIAQYRNVRDPIIPVDSDSAGSIAYLAREPVSDAMLSFITLMEYLWHLASGASPESLGFQLGANESGVAREKAQDALAARARRWRRTLQLNLAHIAYNLGCPHVPLDFTWHVGPFESRKDRNAEIRADAAAGLITTQAAAKLLGYADQDIAQAQSDDMSDNPQEE